MIDDQQQDDTILFINKNSNLTNNHPRLPIKHSNKKDKMKKSNDFNFKNQIEPKTSNQNKKVKRFNIKLKTQSQERQTYTNNIEFNDNQIEKQQRQTINEENQNNPIQKGNQDLQKLSEIIFSQRDQFNPINNDKWQGNTFYLDVKKKIHQKLKTQPDKNNKFYKNSLTPQKNTNKPKSKLTVSTLQIALDPMCKKLMEQPFEIQRKIYRKVQSNISLIKANPQKMIRNLSAKLVRDPQTIKNNVKKYQQGGQFTGINLNQPQFISKSERNLNRIQKNNQKQRKNIEQKSGRKTQKNTGVKQQKQKIRQSIKTEEPRKSQIDIQNNFIKQYRKKLRKRKFSNQEKDKKVINTQNFLISESQVLQKDKKEVGALKLTKHSSQRQKQQKPQQINNQESSRTKHKKSIKNIIDYNQASSNNYIFQKLKTEQSPLQIIKKLKQIDAQIMQKQKQTKDKTNRNSSKYIPTYEISNNHHKDIKYDGQQFPMNGKLASQGLKNQLNSKKQLLQNNKNKSPLKIQTFDTNPLLFYFKARNNIKISTRQTSIKKIRIKSTSKAFVGS